MFLNFRLRNINFRLYNRYTLLRSSIQHGEVFMKQKIRYSDCFIERNFENDSRTFYSFFPVYRNLSTR